MTRKKQVRTVIFDTVKKQKGLSLGIVSAVIGAVVFALIPPLILADIVDSITAGTDAAFARILLYFAMLALTGFKDTIESMEKGYDTRCTDDLFSQGQWQLLSIARAAAAAPSMLLFDEITANLDAKTEAAVLDALERVANHRTVISISHRTSARLGRVIQIEAN